MSFGEQLKRLGQSAAAVGMGEIGFAHLALIARTSAAVGERLNERKLIRKASELSVRSFRTACSTSRDYVAGAPEDRPRWLRG